MRTFADRRPEPGAGAPFGWLAEVVRPRREPVPWEQMARAMLAMCAPLAAGLASGLPVTGLLLAIGGLLGTVVDRGGPYRARLKQIASASLLGGAAGLMIGEFIHGRGWVAVAVLVLVAGVSAVASAASAIASVTSLQLLVYAAFGMGPLGALRPWWMVPATVLGGVAWAAVLLVPGWLRSPRAAERRRIVDLYRALARKIAAIGTPGFAAQRQAVTAALNAAYDEVLTERSAVGGRDEEMRLLVSLLNQAHVIAEASTALAYSGHRPSREMTSAAGDLPEAILYHRPPPVIAPLPAGASRAARALYEGLTGAADLLAGRPGGPQAGGAGPRQRPRIAERLATFTDRIRAGRTTRVFTVRLMLCVALAALCSEVLPLQRSYWVILTVAIVLKPDFGSVFTRAVQRGLGTVAGAVAGALILAVVPAGPLLLIPLTVFAALLPYGRSRNYGLFSVFLTPLVVLLIDLLARGGWRLAEARLIDTLLGCAIVLIVGYAAWPMGWQADLPKNFANALEHVAAFTERALAPGAGPDAERSRLRRQSYRALSDLRTEFQRTMAEPAAVRRRAAAWWPAVVAVEQIMDRVTALAVRGEQCRSLPPEAATELAAALRRIAAAVRKERSPLPPGRLPEAEPLRPVTEAIGSLTGMLAA